MAKYINPFTDFGFKKLFGEEVNKDLLIDFLNELLPARHKIATLFYRQNENLGSAETDRKAIFDIYCENQNGEKFIVELQKAKINFFKDPAIYYSSFPIREQAQKGDWNYELQAVYCIGILDFVFDENSDPMDYMHRVQLKNEKCVVFYDKLTYLFIEMPRFNKTEEQLETHFDKWLYLIKNLERFERIPQQLQEKMFLKVFATAEIARFDPQQMQAYESSLKYYRDLKNVIDTSFMEGKEEGKEEGRKEGKKERDKELVRNAMEEGMSIELISRLTGLSAEQIEQLRDEL